MSKVWIDTTSGTWGVVDDSQGRLMIVDTDDVLDEETLDKYSVWAALDAMSDSEVAEFGYRYGHLAT